MNKLIFNLLELIALYLKMEEQPLFTCLKKDHTKTHRHPDIKHRIIFVLASFWYKSQP